MKKIRSYSTISTPPYCTLVLYNLPIKKEISDGFFKLEGEMVTQKNCTEIKDIYYISCRFCRSGVQYLYFVLSVIQCT